MLNSLICGTSNLPEEEHNFETLIGPCSKSTPKKHKKNKDSKNPYSDRGLDKFYALLDELESKKQKIYTQKGSQDISFVRFVYSSSDDWKPIVVKAKERTQAQNQGKTKIIAPEISEKKAYKRLIEDSESDPVEEIKERAGSRSNFKIENLKEPSWYMPLMIVLILLFLIIYGKTFAILCSSIGWYLLTMIKASSPGSGSSWSSTDDPKRKKYVGKLSDNSPRSVLSAPEEQSSAGHAHRKSW